MKKTKTIGNVTFVERSKSWYETMTYTELLSEKRFMLAEKQRVKKARAAAAKVDPRGMWCEVHEIDRMFKEMEKGCESIVVWLQKEMIKRINKGE